VTTVGYGDFTCERTSEYILAIIWMAIGVSLYSFTIGSVSSLIATIDAKEAVLVNKIGSLRDYKRKYSLPAKTTFRIKTFLENSSKTDGLEGEWEVLFKQLPH